jgi:thioredoxin reductase (NADPH)
MSTVEHVSVLIIGSGPSGYTAAIYAARAGLNPVLYQGMQPGGQLTITTEVENFPGYPDGAQGPEMMVDFERQATRMGADIRMGWVSKVDLNAIPKRVWVNEETEITADSVIISTGASAKWLGLESEQRLNGFGVSACAVCDGFFFRGQEVAIVGAGDTAAEEATYLAKLCKKVTMLVRKDKMRASVAMQNRVFNTPNIEVLWNTETVEILGSQSVEALKVRNIETGVEHQFPIQGFFVAIGHEPNTNIFKGQLTMDETGYLVVEPGTTKTNIPGVFAAGDVADKNYRQAITAAGTGCMAALDAERYLASIGH